MYFNSQKEKKKKAEGKRMPRTRWRQGRCCCGLRL